MRQKRSFSGLSVWNYFREGNNFSYVRQGEVEYGKRSHNNVAISFHPSTFSPSGFVKDSLIVIDDSGQVSREPLNDLSKISREVIRMLEEVPITYNIPQKVIQRENLPWIDENELKEVLKTKYGISVEASQILPCGRSKTGLRVLEEANKRYILKYRGEDPRRVEAISDITMKAEGYFPRVFSSTENEAPLQFGRNVYSLEEFVEGTTLERNLDYFSLIGSHMARLHNLLEIVSQEGNALELILLNAHDPFSESNMIAVYVDLFKQENGEKEFVLDLEDLFTQRINDRLRALPKSFVHMDLNQSNLVWQGDHPTIIDLEDIRNTSTIYQFVAPLLLRGNMDSPHYVEGSLETITNSYNGIANTPLTDEEIEVLGDLLKFSLLRYYCTRTIRRSFNESSKLVRDNLRRLESK